MKNYWESVRSLLHDPRTRRGTCQLFVLNFPNFGGETFNQGHETSKAPPNLAKCWFFERLRTTRQSYSGRSCLVRHKDRGDDPYDLVERPAPVCHRLVCEYGPQMGARERVDESWEWESYEVGGTVRHGEDARPRTGAGCGRSIGSFRQLLWRGGSHGAIVLLTRLVGPMGRDSGAGAHAYRRSGSSSPLPHVRIASQL